LIVTGFVKGTLKFEIERASHLRCAKINQTFVIDSRK
jgi:hypothetical protein